MTKDTAIKIRDNYHRDINSPTFINYVVGAWITNIPGTDIWFVDVHEFNAHSNIKDYFFKVGYDK